MSTVLANAEQNAETVVASSGSSANAAPVTMIDSPRQMMTNRLTRSAMCSPRTTHVLAREAPSHGSQNIARGPARSITHATAHSTSRCSSTSAPVIHRLPETTNHVVMRAKFTAFSGHTRPRATSTNALRPTCIVTSITAKSRALSPNASGIALASTRPSSMRTTSIARTGTRSGSSQLVAHIVKTHTHHTATPRTSVCTRVSAPGWAMRPCESCVTAKTNTRSKKSST